MKTSTILALALSMGAADAAAQTGSQTGSLSRADVRSVSPALERYAADRLANDLWKRPGLSARDRSIVTLTAIITRNQGILLAEQVPLGLDNGVKPAEISEIITHLAFYAGWGNAMAAVAITKELFEARGIGADRLLVLLLLARAPSPPPPVRKAKSDLGAVIGAVWLPGLGAALSSTGYGAILAFGSLLYARHQWQPVWLGFTAFGAALIAARAVWSAAPMHERIVTLGPKPHSGFGERSEESRAPQGSRPSRCRLLQNGFSGLSHHVDEDGIG